MFVELDLLILDLHGSLCKKPTMPIAFIDLISQRVMV